MPTSSTTYSQPLWANHQKAAAVISSNSVHFSLMPSAATARAVTASASPSGGISAPSMRMRSVTRSR